MAVDAPVLIGGWWVYLRYNMGSTHLNPNDKQINNAYRIRRALIAQGYTDLAIAGVIGCFQVESGLSPGALDTHLSQLPNNGEILSALTNTVMLGYCDYANPSARGYGTGLAQWDRGVSSASPQGNVIASYAIRNNMEWYSGDLQMMRLEAEYQADLLSPGTFWHYNWGSFSWQDFKSLSTGTPSNSADIWTSCFEVSSLDPTGRQNRRDNAEYWYQYFIDHPLPITSLLIIMNRRKELLRRGKHP